MRAPRTRTRVRPVSIRFTSDEHEMIEEAARREHLPISILIRRALLPAVRRIATRRDLKLPEVA